MKNSERIMSDEDKLLYSKVDDMIEKAEKKGEKKSGHEL